jgi:hypothetical protein
MFQLEALKARHGDCLLLHWGTEDDTRLALIDGGPGGTYDAVLKPRLEELAEGRPTGTLNIDLMMVSHIDDDHIAGLLSLADDVELGRSPVSIGLLWHNSLEGLLEGALPGEPANVATASVKEGFREAGRGWDEWSEKVLASVPQGQHLHAFAKRQGLADTMNAPFQPLVIARPAQAAADIAGLELTVLAPDIDAVENLRTAWRKKRDDGITAAYSDRSPYNLSSIVVVARFGDKSMLLTGDALGREVIEGLEKKGLLRDGKAHFNLMKLPHHGSQNNVVLDFFQRITADVYMVSGDGPDGRFPNPHPKAMNWLKEARGDAEYIVYCTYDLPYLRDIFGDRLRVPAAGSRSVLAAVG